MDREYIDLEVERIKILFEENNYSLEDMKNFIDIKMNMAKENNDKVNLRICEKLINEISKQ